MAPRTASRLIRDAIVATLLPNTVWTYLTWRHKLGVGTTYVWPWVLLDTLLYAHRADKFGLNSGLRGIIAYDLLSIRVAFVPFFAAITLPMLNFAFSPHAPVLSLPVVLVLSGASWWLHDIIATLSRLRQRNNL